MVVLFLGDSAGVPVYTERNYDASILCGLIKAIYYLVELFLTVRTVSIAFVVASHKINESVNGRHGSSKLLIYYNILLD